jgi:hypothetical protein
MASPRAPEFDRLIGDVADELRARQLPFMLIGGQAVLVHGEPRLTNDIDITLGVGPSRSPAILDLCQALSLEPLPDEPRAFAERTFVLPVADPVTRIRIDFVFSTTPYEEQAIARAVPIYVGGTWAPFATAEDLILHKLFAGRPRDLEDAKGVVARKGAMLDWKYLERWAQEFSAVEGRENLPELVRYLRSGGR